MPHQAAYAELHCLSNFSFLRGASHAEELVARAAELGYAALAITDRNSLAGVVRAHVAAKEHGLHLVIGAEITPVDAAPIVLLAPNRVAYGRLARLITRGRLRCRKGACEIRLADVAELGSGAGLIGIVVPAESHEATKPRSRAGGGRCPVAAPELAAFAPYGAYRAIFGDDCFLAAELAYDVPDAVRLERLRALSEQTGLPLVAANDVHYHVPERRYLQDVLTCIREKCTLTSAGRRLLANAERHLRPRDEIARRYAPYHELLQRTVDIARRCTFSLDELRYEYPHELVPPGVTAHEYLTRLTWAGARERYGRSHGATEPRSHEGEDGGDQDVSRLNRLAEGDGAGQTGLSGNDADARDRALRSDGADASLGRVDSVEHRRGARVTESDGIPALLEDSARLADGIADAVAAGESAGVHSDSAVAERASNGNRPRTTGIDLQPGEIASVSSSWLRGSAAPWLPSSVRRQLDAELALIAELKYEHYFLTVWDLVRFARERGILCQGRGSAANSAVCYCLGVTAVDPARIDLLFERFISRERNEPPDIDIDFEHERREEVFQYIYEKYGRERAAITAEVISYRPRSAVRDVGKALGLSLDRVDVLAKALDWWSDEAVPEEALRAAGLDPQDRTVQMVVRLVRQILGFPRHLSQHVGGFVITETPLCEIVPLENGAMPDRTFIEWDKNDIDALGILKVDCLALGMLTAIGKCFGMLQRHDRREQGTGNREQRGGAGRGHECRAAQRCYSGWAAQIGKGAEDDGGLSRIGCVAEEHRTSKGCVSAHTTHAGERAIRADQSDATGQRLDPEQHCGGQRAAVATRLFALSDDCAGVAGRTGDAGDNRGGAGIAATRFGCTESNRRNRAHIAGTDQEPAAGAVSRDTVPCSLFPVPSSLTDIPPEDPLVYDMICAADTVGVFQIESRAQVSMLPRLKPRCFYDLVIEVAIVRPGPIQGGMVHPYLRRRDGLEPVWYPSPAVRGVLEKTLGVPLFQEQVMRVAVVAAGFTPGEADQLRRSMAAWGRGGKIESFQIRLIQGMLANGYPPAFAEQIFKQIRGFGEYGFPESHAASFALLVYVSAWLKRYHPAAFTGAILNSLPMGFYAPAQLVRDALRHGVVVLPVDVGRSGWDCSLEERDRGIEGSRDRGEDALDRSGTRSQPSIPCPLDPLIPAVVTALRLGLRLIRGLSAEKVRGIEAAQREGGITSIHALARRPDVSRETLLRLAAADAFRSLGLSRRAALWEILALDDHPAPLFAEMEPSEPPANLPVMPMDEVVVQDYDALGLSLNAHPIGLVREELTALKVSPCERLLSARARQRIAVAGLVTHRQRPGTAKGLVFMTLEDETGTANLIIRPQVWDRDRRVGRGKVALIAAGVVERVGAVIHVQVTRLSDLSAQIAPVRAKSRDFH